jgi:predicted membrane protein
MTTAITQTFGQQFLLNHAELWYLIAFAIFFVFFNAFGWFISGRALGASFSTVVTFVNLVLGFIPFWVALIGFTIAVIEIGSCAFRKEQEEKPENPQNPPEITDTFDKSQFKRG